MPKALLEYMGYCMVAGIQAGGSQTISKRNRSAYRVRHLAHIGVNMLSIRSKCK